MLSYQWFITDFMKNFQINNLDKENHPHNTLHRIKQPKRAKRKCPPLLAQIQPNTPSAEVLTFGDWKQFNVEQENRDRNKDSIQFVDDKPKQSLRLKQYQEIKLKKVNDSERYKPKPLFPTNNTIIRRFCIGSERRRQSIDPSDFTPRKSHSRDSVKSQGVQRNNKHNHESTRLQTFKGLYLRQKERYEKVLRNYKIDEKVEDELWQLCL